jgi:hypothetical protein
MLNTHIELWPANENKLWILLTSTTNTFYDYVENFMGQYI